MALLIAVAFTCDQRIERTKCMRINGSLATKFTAGDGSLWPSLCFMRQQKEDHFRIGSIPSDRPTYHAFVTVVARFHFMAKCFGQFFHLSTVSSMK